MINPGDEARLYIEFRSPEHAMIVGQLNERNVVERSVDVDSDVSSALRFVFEEWHREVTQ